MTNKEQHILLYNLIIEKYNKNGFSGCFDDLKDGVLVENKERFDCMPESSCFACEEAEDKNGVKMSCELCPIDWGVPYDEGIISCICTSGETAHDLIYDELEPPSEKQNKKKVIELLEKIRDGWR